MYEFYYFENKVDSFGKHQIHRGACNFLPHIDDRTVLSYDRSSLGAFKNAEIEYLAKSFSLCKHCYKKLDIN